MFSSLFNYDNPVWNFVGKFFDLMILNLLWFICSIPIFTIGASTTAVYYMTLKLVRDEGRSTIQGFFKSFKENFKQATIIWLIMIVVGLIIGFDLFFFLKIQTEASMLRSVMVAVFLGFGILFAFTSLYVFPVLARFENTIKKTIINALFMSIRHFGWTLAMLVCGAALIALPFLGVSMLMPILFLFGLPLFAFVYSFFFVKVFDVYMPKVEERDPNDMRPLFADEDELVIETVVEEKTEL